MICAKTKALRMWGTKLSLSSHDTVNLQHVMAPHKTPVPELTLHLGLLAWFLATVINQCTCYSMCALLCGINVKMISPSAISFCFVIWQYNYGYLKHVSLGNVNIEKKIDASIGLCYMLNTLRAYRINALMVPPQSSPCCMEEHLEWSFHTWLLYVWSDDIIRGAKSKVFTTVARN